MLHYVESFEVKEMDYTVQWVTSNFAGSSQNYMQQMIWIFAIHQIHLLGSAAIVGNTSGTRLLEW
jgi:hypothetical protein